MNNVSKLTIVLATNDVLFLNKMDSGIPRNDIFLVSVIDIADLDFLLNQLFPSVVMLDVDCWGDAVYDSVCRLRSEHLLLCPVVFTSDNDLEIGSDVLRQGIDFFIGKAVDTKAFSSIIHSLAFKSGRLIGKHKALTVSDPQLLALLDALDDAVVTIDSEHRIVFFSSGAEAVFARSSNDVLGEKIGCIVSISDEHGDFEKHLSSADGDLSFQGFRGDGSVFFCECRASKWQQGAFSYVTLVLRDVSYKKRMKVDLAGSERRAESILKHAKNAIITIDDSGVIQSFNLAAEQLFGYKKEELIGNNVTLLMPERYRDTHNAYIDGYSDVDVERIIGRARDVIGLRKDGSIFPVEIAITQVNIDGNKLYIGTIIDISEHKRIEESLREAKNLSDMASRAKSVFLSSMSHELRSPLNSILGFAQLLADDNDLNDSQRENVSHIFRSGKLLLSLINDVLDLSRIESGHVAVEMEPIAVVNAVSDCLLISRSIADRHRIRINHHVGDFESATIFADKTRFSQVVLNLLSNAIKYNREGGKVDVHYQRDDGGFLRMIISDTGMGVPADKLDAIFEPFQRMGYENSDVEGVGIGLSITKSLVTLMEGRIGIDSVENQGTSIWVSFHELEPHVADGFTGVASNRSVEMPAGSSARILYVEDNPTSRLLMEKVFSRLKKYQLMLAVDAESGLDMVKKFRPDVILMDIDLPGMSGVEAACLLKADPQTADIPVLALSAHALSADVEKALTAGFYRYLTKPVVIDEVLAAIDQAIGVGVAGKLAG